MYKCPQCQTEFDGVFCPECGTRKSEEKTCPECGAVVGAGAKFCVKCGYSFSESGLAAENRIKNAEISEPKTKVERKPAASSLPVEKIRKILKLVPFGLFALYSVLLFAFFGGGVYKTDFDIFETPKSVYAISDVSDMIDGIKASLVFLVIFLIVSLALSALMALNLFYPKCKNKVVSFKGKFYLPLTYVLQGAAYALYFIFLVISAVIMGKVSSADEGMGIIKAGAAPKLILSFAIIFAAFSAAANVVSFLAARKFPEIAANEKKELEIAIENKKKADSERQEKKKTVESVQTESDKKVYTIVNDNDIIDSTPTLLRGKPALTRVDSYMRMRRVLKGMSIPIMIFALLPAASVVFSLLFSNIAYVFEDYIRCLQLSYVRFCYLLAL